MGGVQRNHKLRAQLSDNLRHFLNLQIYQAGSQTESVHLHVTSKNLFSRDGSDASIFAKWTLNLGDDYAPPKRKAVCYRFRAQEWTS